MGDKNKNKSIKKLILKLVLSTLKYYYYYS